MEERAQAKPPVLFVGLDGADWQLLDELMAAGAMPNLAKLKATSSWGVLRTEKPPLSPLLWTTMVTGVSPAEHGVLDFSRFRPSDGYREPITRDEREAPAIWNLETWAGKRVAVFGLWATYPAEAVDGVFVSDRLFGFLNVEDEPPPGTIYPPSRETWARETLRSVWRETDYEAVKRYLPWLTEAEYREHAESDRPYEHPISALRRILVETEVYERLFREVFQERPPDLSILYLQGTDSVGHVFASFAPPKQAAVSLEDYERYSRVPELYFRTVDDRLGELVELAESAGAVLVLASDHGFYWKEDRPERLSSFANATAAKWHREEGIYLVSGPGIPAGKGAEAGVRQLFPTLLSLTGLPAAAGTEDAPFGPVAPPPPPPIDFLPIYRELARRNAVAPSAPVSTSGGEEELAKLQALGYLGAAEPARAPEGALAEGSTRTAGSYNNLGIVLRGERKDEEARAAFEKAVELDSKLASALWNLSDLLHQKEELDKSDAFLVRALAADLPEGVRYTVGRAIGYQRAGMLPRSLDLIDRAVEVRPDEKELWLFRGRYRVESRDCAGALEDFRRAGLLAPGDPAVHASIGLAALCLGDRDAARAALERSLELDPNQGRVRQLLAGLSQGGG
ncbi:MAG: alkaline phosphatase family protein [Holophagales bacterium]|nr:alkaline phosphatase family protein [Holophagales bacterium]